ncbi:hypothetical protein PMZ80_003058 [Knufia obscura]|uniref:NADH:flavin oxidoreductase/NADH oxidase N-terminal domain-containing protein n=2 Tax=Knufia TaxID=430999 RepID=A0AAN8I521_9EURO|nr:hypothetical protein PMZ80_003058 [Knufia obscura]KAK5952354.1 hypothetical protein OHC33_006397 [Knufia fluminis]
MSHNRLFQPLKLGNVKLDHRIIMAPLTRFRADDQHVQIDIAKDYYAQRSSTPGTLLITEATFISPQASGYNNVPGIWNDKQIAAWKEVTNAVHAKGCFIYLQLWALGRVAVPKNLQRQEGGPYPVVSASAVPAAEGGHVPKALTTGEIESFIQDYAQAAKNAITAGFDGVEIHGANGYLIDQFWQDVCNKRTDEYGGSVEKRARFGLEVTKAVIEAVGDSKKVGMRLSPWSDFQGMKMEDPVPQFLHVIKELKKLDLAYLHLVESRLSGDSATGVYHAVTRENDPFVELWGEQAPIILAGGFTPAKAKKVVSEIYTGENVCVAFGRHFISTPDLPFRLQRGIEFNHYDRTTFYKKMSAEGYTDYPYSKEWLAAQKNSSRL